MKNLTYYLNVDSIKIVEQSTHDEVIDLLLDSVKDSKNIEDHDDLRKLILERENIISTGIGVGLAIPHARKDSIEDFVISAVLIKKGCDWNSIDSNPVNFAIMIASPKDTHREYLRILAQMVLFWKDTDKRKKVINAKTPQEIYDALSCVEFELFC